MNLDLILEYIDKVTSIITISHHIYFRQSIVINLCLYVVLHENLTLHWHGFLCLEILLCLS